MVVGISKLQQLSLFGSIPIGWEVANDEEDKDQVGKQNASLCNYQRKLDSQRNYSLMKTYDNLRIHITGCIRQVSHERSDQKSDWICNHSKSVSRLAIERDGGNSLTTVFTIVFLVCPATLLAMRLRTRANEARNVPANVNTINWPRLSCCGRVNKRIKLMTGMLRERTAQRHRFFVRSARWQIKGVEIVIQAPMGALYSRANSWLKPNPWRMTFLKLMRAPAGIVIPKVTRAYSHVCIKMSVMQRTILRED